MVEKDVQDRLDKLARLEASTKERSRRYLDKVKESGKVQISGVISTEAYNQLCLLRDRGMRQGVKATTGTVLESLLLSNTNMNNAFNVNIDVKPEPKEPEYSLFDYLDEPKATDTPEPETMVKPAPVVDQEDIKIVPEPKADNMNLESILLAIDADGGSWIEKAKKINLQGVLTKRGKPFTANNLRMAVASIKKRQDKP